MNEERAGRVLNRVTLLYYTVEPFRCGILHHHAQGRIFPREADTSPHRPNAERQSPGRSRSVGAACVRPRMEPCPEFRPVGCRPYAMRATTRRCVGWEVNATQIRTDSVPPTNIIFDALSKFEAVKPDLRVGRGRRK